MSQPIEHIGTPGKPWGDAEKAEWRARQVRQRSHADEVMAKIAANGRTINQAEVEMGATRTTEPAQPGAGSVDLGVYDRLTERASA